MLERTKTRSFNIRGEIRSVINKLDTQTRAGRPREQNSARLEELPTKADPEADFQHERRGNYRPRFVSHSWHVAPRIDDARKISPRAAPDPRRKLLFCPFGGSPNLAVYSGFADSRSFNAAFARRPLLPPVPLGTHPRFPFERTCDPRAVGIFAVGATAHKYERDYF